MTQAGGRMTLTINRKAYGDLLAEIQPHVITTDAENAIALQNIEKLLAKTAGVPRSICTQMSDGRNAREQAIAPHLESTIADIDKRCGV